MFFKKEKSPKAPVEELKLPIQLPPHLDEESSFCPICSKRVKNQEMDSHISACLDGGSLGGSSSQNANPSSSMFDQDISDEELARKLQEQFLEEERAAKEQEDRSLQDFLKSEGRGAPSAAGLPCEKCKNSASFDDAMFLDNCPHTFCRPCIHDFVVRRVDSGRCSDSDLVCPVTSCARTLSPSDIKGCLDPAEYERYENKVLENLISSRPEFIKCPNGHVLERLPVSPSKACAPSPSSGRSAAVGASGAAQAAEKGPNGQPLSREAIYHRDTHRFRCRECSVEFCGSCGTSPYHLGFTCDQHKAYLQAKKCRFCGVGLNASNSSIKAGDPPSLLDVCNAPECVDKKSKVCTKSHKCGHHCGGLRGETKCLPCLDPACCPPGAQQTAEDFCNICYVESLSSAPTVLLECGHAFHYSCVIDKLEKKWPGARMTFGFLDCPLCKKRLAHPALTVPMKPFLDMYEDVNAKSLQRLQYESLASAPEIVKPGAKFYKDPEGYALHTFCYYPCFKCKQPYFGGHRRCEDAAEDAERQFDPTELVCGSCSAGSGVKECPKHGNAFIEFKCKFCCNVANWFCWGNTHFCDSCHKKQETGDYLTRKKRDDLPKCPGPDKCKLKVAHPPNGEEFPLGCAICRNVSSF